MSTLIQDFLSLPTLRVIGISIVILVPLFFVLTSFTKKLITILTPLYYMHFNPDMIYTKKPPYVLLCDYIFAAMNAAAISGYIYYCQNYMPSDYSYFVTPIFVLYMINSFLSIVCIIAHESKNV